MGSSLVEGRSVQRQLGSRGPRCVWSGGEVSVGGALGHERTQKTDPRGGLVAGSRGPRTLKQGLPFTHRGRKPTPGQPPRLSRSLWLALHVLCSLKPPPSASTQPLPRSASSLSVHAAPASLCLLPQRPCGPCLALPPPSASTRPLPRSASSLSVHAAPASLCSGIC